jgi:3'-phosphoadenosine 5'-phosphosulfate sulfotransferase
MASLFLLSVVQLWCNAHVNQSTLKVTEAKDIMFRGGTFSDRILEVLTDLSRKKSVLLILRTSRNELRED